MKLLDDIGVTKAYGGHVTDVLCPVILLSTLFITSPAQAENPSDITQYTLQRDKTSEFVSSALRSGERPEIEVVEKSGVYSIKVVALIAAPADYVRFVLTDYRHIYRLNPSIIESEVLEQSDDEVTVRMKVAGCAAYFCEELDRVEKVRVLPSGDIYAEIIPEMSQFASGATRWRIKQQGDYCEVVYTTEMEPSVFVPPVVGKFLIKKSIKEGVLTSFRNLEKVSSILAAREWLEVDQVLTEVKPKPLCDSCVSNADDVRE